MYQDSKLSNQYKTVLVLDDEFDIALVIKNPLKKEGFYVFGFTNPFLALEHFRQNMEDYCIILSDIRMPGMNGFEFTREIRKIKPDVKVLLMTAVDINTTTFSEELLATKVNGFIQKPVSIKELKTIIQSHVKECQVLKENRIHIDV